MSSPEPDAQGLWSALIDESITAREAMRDSLQAPFQRACDSVVAALRAGNKLLLLGNGGSAADAQHVAAEFVGRFRLERRAWPALALSENISSLTGISNDYAYETVFVRQLEAFARAGDVLIALSTSGTSASVVQALECAGRLGLTSIALTGPSPNLAAERADIAVCVPAPTTASVQEGYMLVLHAICHFCEETLERV